MAEDTATLPACEVSHTPAGSAPYSGPPGLGVAGLSASRTGCPRGRRPGPPVEGVLGERGQAAIVSVVPKGNGAPSLIRPFSLYSSHFWGHHMGAEGAPFGPPMVPPDRAGRRAYVGSRPRSRWAARGLRSGVGGRRLARTVGTGGLTRAVHEVCPNQGSRSPTPAPVEGVLGGRGEAASVSVVPKGNGAPADLAPSSCNQATSGGRHRGRQRGSEGAPFGPPAVPPGGLLIARAAGSGGLRRSSLGRVPASAPGRSDGQCPVLARTAGHGGLERDRQRAVPGGGTAIRRFGEVDGELTGCELAGLPELRLGR
jgi:hypothetical protein